MSNEFLPVSALLSEVIFDGDISHEIYIEDKYINYVLSDYSRIFSWQKKDTGSKIRISKDAMCGLSKNFQRLENVDKLAASENEYRKIISLIKNVKKKGELINEKIRIYEQGESAKIKRYDIHIIGSYSAEEKQIEGIIEIITIYNQVEVYQKSIGKYIHDIKNQMMIMLSTANNIQNEADKMHIKKYAYFLKDTVYGCNYMLSFINTESSLTNNRKLFNMHHIIVSLMDTFRGESDIKFSNILNADNPRVYANRVLISNVIYNVIINAIQAMEHKGKIALKTYNKKSNPNTDYECDKWLFIEIQDSGDGIADDIKDKILDSDFTTKSGGSGLGLYSSKSTLLLHNGTIDVESDQEGGAVFKIALPCHIE